MRGGELFSFFIMLIFKGECSERFSLENSASIKCFEGFTCLEPIFFPGNTLGGVYYFEKCDF